MFNKEPNFDYLNLYQERPLPPLSNDLFSSIKPILTEQTDYSPNPYKIYLFKKQQNFPYDIIHNAETSINEDSYFSNNKSSKLGRKKKGDNREALHDKSKRDNIKNKIKTRIFNHYIISLIEKNSLDEINIQKLPTEFNAQLKKEVNKELLDTTIKDILSNQSISSKYVNPNKNIDFDYNKKIIDKILLEKKEVKVIKILNLTLKEIVIIFRKRLNDEINNELYDELKKNNKIDDSINIEENDIINFIEKIKKEDSENLDDYIEDVKHYCLTFEYCFE